MRRGDRGEEQRGRGEWGRAAEKYYKWRVVEARTEDKWYIGDKTIRKGNRDHEVEDGKEKSFRIVGVQ
jgi:hypothetical protein